MTSVSVAEAKNHLSELIARVEAGEEIAVTRRGKPVAKLVAAATVDEKAMRKQVAVTFGSCATNACEPCQVRKEAALSNDFSCATRVPGLS